MWLRDCLPDHVPGARIITFGYNANVLNDVSIGRLRTFAETFLENLRLERDSEKVSRADNLSRGWSVAIKAAIGHSIGIAHCSSWHILWEVSL